MSKLIVALDVNDLFEAFRLIDILSDIDCVFKIGPIPYLNFGDALFEKLRFHNKKFFIDFKFHDIPNTVSVAVLNAAKKGASMITLHCSGGRKMLEAAVLEVNNAFKEGLIKEKPILLGITVLTSLNDSALEELGFKENVKDTVIRFARIAKEAGLDGVVASAREVRMIKESVGEDFIVVTPGIRPAWSVGKDDQSRIITPEKAALDGSDYIVVGRPILKAEDPLIASNKIIEELKSIKKKTNLNQKEILNKGEMGELINNLVSKILEKNQFFEDLAIIGIKTRGAYLAKRLAQNVEMITKNNIMVGYLHITLYRDDLTELAEQPLVKLTEIPFDIHGKNVILVDDVIYTGRTIRAAIDALLDLGRPKSIQLVEFVDRGHRELPIQADFMGKFVSTSKFERIHVNLEEVDKIDNVVIV